MTAPPVEVLEAWSVDAIAPLAGGQKRAWRASGIVFKPVDDEARAGALATGLASAVGSTSIRIARPVASTDGRWVVDGWAAWAWLEGEHRDLGWEEHLEVSDWFHAAVADMPHSAVLPGSDRWTAADQAAWSEGNSHDWSGQ